MVLNKKADKKAYKEEFIKALEEANELLDLKLSYREDESTGLPVFMLNGRPDYECSSYQEALIAANLFIFFYGPRDIKDEDITVMRFE